MKTHCWRHVVLPLLGAALLASAAAAQGVADPTRPPPALMPAVPGAAPAGPPRAAVAVQPAPERWRVQSLHLPRSGPASALVSDRLVRVGDRLGDKQVVAIDAHGLQLRGPKGALDRLPLLDSPPSPDNPVPPHGAAPVASIAGGKQP